MIDIADFRSWLENLHPGYIIGFSCDPYRCPVANHIFEVVAPGRTTTVTWVGYTIGDDAYDTPTWAKKFIRLTDSLGRNKSITASMALNILNEVAPA